MRLMAGVCIALAGLIGSAEAQTSDKFTIGVMGDQSGVVSDVGGKGSVLAARMAVADFGGQVLGKPIEILVADHQNKPDVASPIARRWFDTEGVEAIFDLPHTGVVLALQNIARDKQKSLLVSGAASVEITGKSCSPYTTHWTDDTYALANATAKAVTKGARRDLVLPDGRLQLRPRSRARRQRHRSARSAARAGQRPPSAVDAGLLGLPAAGAVERARIDRPGERRRRHGQRHQAGQGIQDRRRRPAPGGAARLHHRREQPRPADGAGPVITSGFYWDATDGTRDWARRFMAEHGRMPTREQAGVYVSVLHYLKAVQAAGKPTPRPSMRRCAGCPSIASAPRRRARRRPRIYDIGVYQVKAPAESTAPWDYYRRIASVPGADASGRCRRRLRLRTAGEP